MGSLWPGQHFLSINVKTEIAREQTNQHIGGFRFQGHRYQRYDVKVNTSDTCSTKDAYDTDKTFVIVTLANITDDTDITNYTKNTNELMLALMPVNTLNAN